MPRFELEWTMTGSAVIEADDPAEAKQLLEDGLVNLDHSDFESIDCDDVVVRSTEPVS